MTHWIGAEALDELDRVEEALTELDLAPPSELSAAIEALRTELTGGAQ